MDESSVIDLGKSQLDTNSNLDSKVKDNKWHMVLGIEFDVVLTSYATCGWAGQALAHPDFESSVNPIPTRDITTGATGATEVAPKFSDTLPYHNQGGQILPSIAEVAAKIFP